MPAAFPPAFLSPAMNVPAVAGRGIVGATATWRTVWTGPQISNGAATSCVINISSAPEGEAVFAAICLSDSQASAPTAPAGWSAVINNSEGVTGGSSSRTMLFSRVKQPGDTTFTFSWPTTTQVAALPFCYPGADTSVTFESAGYLAHTSGTAYASPTVTPVDVGRTVVMLTHSRGTTSPGPSPFTPDPATVERADFQSPSNPWSGLELADTDGAVSVAGHTYTSQSAQPSGHGSVIVFALIPAGSGAVAGAATLSGTGTLAAAPYFDTSAALSGSGTLTAAPVLAGSAALSGTGTLAATSAFIAAAALSGSGTLGALWTFGGTAAMSGSGTLAGAETIGTTAAMSGSGTLAASWTFGDISALSGSGTLSASPAFAASAALSGTGTLAGLWTTTRQPLMTGTGTLGASPPPFLANTAEGGTNGITVTPANSGGASGAPWDSVPIGANATLVYDNGVSPHGTLSYKVTTGVTATTALTEWTTSEGTQATIFFRIYCFIPSTPTPAWRAFSARSGASHAASILFSGTAMQLSAGAAFSTAATFTTHPPIGAWFRVEGSITGDVAAGAISASIYTSMDSTVPAETRSVSSLNTVGALTQYWFGQANSVASSGPFSYGDAGISANGPLGPTGEGGPMSGTGTLAAAPVFTGAGALSGSGTLAAAPVFAAAAALSGSGTLSGAWTFGDTSALSGSGTLSAAQGGAGTATLTGSGTLAAAETIGWLAALSGTGTLSAAPAFAGAAAMSGTGTLAATPAFTPAAAMSGSGTLAAAPVRPATATLSGSGTLAGAPVFAGAAALSGSGTLAGAETIGAVAVLSGSGTLAAASGAAGAATLSGTGTLAGTPAFQGAATLSGLGTLSAVPVQTLQQQAVLSGLGTLAAIGTLGFRPAALLSGTGTLSAGPALGFRATATLSGLGTLAGTSSQRPPNVPASSVSTVTTFAAGTQAVTGRTTAGTVAPASLGTASVSAKAVSGSTVTSTR